ncbi:MAG: DUF898 domain-containing protein [Gammaproteobacteria bacterium]|nr:DUF898 domain-containing protein [Gammaproteobacteria bacterium]MCP4088256.1 DUF898 domain-containing protein [Gammaproteobacteria bacterium]MCP4276433.1 DUF898 domain-containing protein [Gammaproteobacteria bacterium]MCP4831080.1 DUF898 domain-containing protein [Gammaproteobacteria bacterium]MCP4929348.1 DUF898 domain-containing protein [Gammaproteobacteria bacterium]
MDRKTDQSALTRPESVQLQREWLQFNGQAGEYFRIWIVNLLLTILTLGIYSAWAKVRKNCYIYGNLELAGSHFDYTARPLVILRGRLIALALLVIYLTADYFVPLLSGAIILLLSLVTPWVIVRSRMFNMRYTAYRNIKFSFNPVYGEAIKVILLYGLLSVMTLGLAIPFAHFQRNRMLVDNTNFGNLIFRLNLSSKKFYTGYALGALLGIFVLIPMGLFAYTSGMAAQGKLDMSFNLMVALPFLIFGLFYYVVLQFIKAYILRATTNGTSIRAELSTGEVHKLGCDWSLTGMLGIYLSNIVVIVLSLGLLVPWAQMRIFRYQLNHTWVDVSGSLDDVVSGQLTEVSSLGEEIGDVFDVDIGL